MAKPALKQDLSFLDRQTLCLASSEPGVATHCGEDGFCELLAQHVPTAESAATEKLVNLKVELSKADTETFWRRLMEGMTEICHAQYGFVAKRILVDDHDSAVEMPPLGEPGSCLLGVAFYYNDGRDRTAMHRDYKYLAWGAPCGYMKHDKVFLIPEEMSNFITHNPNALPFAAEGYLGLPLFSRGKCFAHFGMMWTQDGLKNRNVSWGFTEMLMHSLEDLIVDRLVSGQGFAKPAATTAAQALTPPEVAKVIPQEAITATQSLKPYAKSLSHELRTPMQGVVGMLDVMHATVQEQIEGQSNPKIRHVFQVLKDNIEVVQDSSKRAVEAADNVVHAYDMNMQVPDTPLHENESPATMSSNYFDYKPARIIEGSNIPANPFKRRRSTENAWHFGNATKVRHIQSSSRREVSPRSDAPPPMISPRALPPQFSSSMRTPEANGLWTGESPARFTADTDTFSIPGSNNSHIREIIPLVINESLRVGGRPDSAISEPTDLGEIIEVRSRSSNGQVSQKTIEWTVEQDVPEVILIDERDLAKLISAVLLNAIKFTEFGKIRLAVRLSQSRRYLLVTMIDTGDGIPEDFQPELFKAFSREDDSLTRSKEGLGLGLLVAKGLARRLGGDISLIRSEVSGENKGSEFEIRVPLEPGGSSSRSGTPLAQTPEPSRPRRRPSISATPMSTSTGHGFGNTTSKTASPAKVDSRTPTISKLLDGEPGTALSARKLSLGPKVPENTITYDKMLAEKYPLTFLVAEDNKINRKLLVNMLGKFGYTDIYEAFDGREAVRIMHDVYYGVRQDHGRGKFRMPSSKKVDVVLMDLWMPEMDGYQATEKILQMFDNGQANSSINGQTRPPTILAVSADVTEEAINRATRTGMEGFMTKPYKLMDLQRLIVEFCVKSSADDA